MFARGGNRRISAEGNWDLGEQQDSLEITLTLTLFQVHYALTIPSNSSSYFFFFQSTRNRVETVPSTAAHGTVFDELFFLFRELFSQILVLRELCLQCYVHRLDVHFELNQSGLWWAR